MPMPPYTLAPHSHVCQIDNVVVLLDLRRDKYLGFRSSDAVALSRYIEGWPISVSARPGETTPPATDDQSILREMLHERIICPRGTCTHAPRATIEPPSQALIEGYDMLPPQVTFVDAVRFLMATASAALALRILSLQTIVTWVGKRATKHSVHMQREESELLRSKVAAYCRMRPIVFTARDKCLRDSLALALFLSPYGLHPRWVFGVSTVPFSSHCWLQYDDVVINDDPEHAAKFTPIMVI